MFFPCGWGEQEDEAALIRENVEKSWVCGVIQGISCRGWGAEREEPYSVLSCSFSSQLEVIFEHSWWKKNRNHDLNFNLNPKSSYDYTSSFIQVSLFSKHGVEPSDDASARVAGLKVSGPRSRPWGCCHFFTLIASVDTRCFEDEDVFTEGAVEGSRGKPLPFSLNTGRSVFSVESCRDKYSILGIC